LIQRLKNNHIANQTKYIKHAGGYRFIKHGRCLLGQASGSQTRDRDTFEGLQKFEKNFKIFLTKQAQNKGISASKRVSRFLRVKKFENCCLAI
jgi:hypothetical protein